MNLQNSIAAFKEAKNSIPGGVNSPVRAFKSVGGDPIFISSAKGSKITDIDGNVYIDYVSSWGPMILGHTHDRVVKAIVDATLNGTSYGAPTLVETQMAEQIKVMVPGVEIVRMVNSGTEATMSALRLARGFTGREKVVKFGGCYHGHADSFLIKAGSGAITLGLPDSPGVTGGTARDTLLAGFNDLESVRKLFVAQGEEIAALIIEPIAGNMGVIIPDMDFLKGVREITSQYGALLIFDEVISGFRVARGGAQELYGVIPDLTTLGKIIGGGLPVGAYGGKKEIMEHLAPTGAVYQAGTLSGNPLAMAAGLETLRIISQTDEFYENLEQKAARLEYGLLDNIRKTGAGVVINRVGSLMTMFFTDLKEVRSFEDAMKSDTGKYARYFKMALEAGIYLAPSQFECAFVSAAHSEKDIDKTIEANLHALQNL